MVIFENSISSFLYLGVLRENCNGSSLYGYWKTSVMLAGQLDKRKLFLKRRKLFNFINIYARASRSAFLTIITKYLRNRKASQMLPAVQLSWELLLKGDPESLNCWHFLWSIQWPDHFPFMKIDYLSFSPELGPCNLYDTSSTLQLNSLWAESLQKVQIIHWFMFGIVTEELILEGK